MVENYTHAVYQVDGAAAVGIANPSALAACLSTTKSCQGYYYFSGARPIISTGLAVVGKAPNQLHGSGIPEAVLLT